MFFENYFQNNFFHNIQSSYLKKHKSGHERKNKLLKVNIYLKSRKRLKDREIKIRKDFTELKDRKTKIKKELKELFTKPASLT